MKIDEDLWWKARDGRKGKLCDLTTDHLSGIQFMCKKKKWYYTELEKTVSKILHQRKQTTSHNDLEQKSSSEDEVKRCNKFSNLSKL